MPSSKRKRKISVFSAIQELDSEDVRSSEKKRARGEQDARHQKAAQSSIQLYKHLMECRILMQTNLLEAETSVPLEACNQILLNLLEARNQLCHLNDDDIDYESVVKHDDDKDNKLEKVLEKEYSQLSQEWKEVLNRRHKDVRLHAGLTAKNQFKVMDASFWQQVQATVSHEETLRRGSQEFDDAKVYQHLLADFLTQSSSTTNAEKQKQQRAVMQNTKKQVDRRASKGRKIRYVVHPKLVNFTFPTARPASNSGMDENEWFSSLFGGVGNK